MNVSEGVLGAGLLAGATSGVVIGIIFFALFLLLVLVLALYVYTSLAWMTIAKKLGRGDVAWVMWIPLVNFGLILSLGGFHWAFVFLLLIPLLGWIPLIVLLFIAQWRIYERRGYYGLLALLPLLDIFLGGIGSLASLIVLGFVAWNDDGPLVTSSPQRVPKKLVQKKK